MNQVIHNGDYVIAHSILYPFTGFYYYDDIVKYNYDLYTAWDWLYIPYWDPWPPFTTPTCNTCWNTPTPTPEITTTALALNFLGLISMIVFTILGSRKIRNNKIKKTRTK